MKTVDKIIVVSLAMLVHAGAMAQPPEKKGNDKKNDTRIKKYAGLQAMIPFGSFSETHVAGAGGDYCITLNRENDVINWAFDAGAAWYAGKKVTVSGYNYKYPSWSLLHLMGGVHFYTGKFDPRVVAGPALRLYNGHTAFVIAGKLEVCYQPASGFSISPVLNMMYEPGTRAHWSAGISAAIEL